MHRANRRPKLKGVTAVGPLAVDVLDEALRSKSLIANPATVYGLQGERSDSNPLPHAGYVI